MQGKEIILTATITKKIYLPFGQNQGIAIKEAKEAWQDETIGKYLTEVKHNAPQ